MTMPLPLDVDVSQESLPAALVKYIDKTITSAQLLALNATPQTLVPGPLPGLANIFLGCFVRYVYATAAYAGIAAGEDLAIKYTNGSGAELGLCEATGFLDLTADALRWVNPENDVAKTPVERAAIVLHMLTGEITTGGGALHIRTYYRTVPTDL
jgi:hypothetical protein